MPLNAQILLSILAHETSAGDLSKTIRVTPASFAMSLSDGTGANQAQVVWSDTRSLGVVAEDIFGVGFQFSDDRGTVSFSALKAVYIRNTSSVSGSIRLYGGDWTNGPLGDALIIKNGAAFFMAATDDSGFATAAPAFLYISNEGGSVQTYEIVLIGEGTIS